MNDAPEDSLFVLLLLLLLWCAQPRLERRGCEVDGVAHLSSGAEVMRYTPTRGIRGLRIVDCRKDSNKSISQVLYTNLRFKRIYIYIFEKYSCYFFVPTGLE